MSGPHTAGADRLPEDVRPYRTIGPFDERSLPAGLRQTHSLKAGSWAKIQIEEGDLAFQWKDGSGERLLLTAPAELIVPPLVPHSVEPIDAIKLSITFFRPHGGQA